jgi:hypothetical protein
MFRYHMGMVPSTEQMDANPVFFATKPHGPEICPSTRHEAEVQISPDSGWEGQANMMCFPVCHCFALLARACWIGVACVFRGTPAKVMQGQRLMPCVRRKHISPWKVANVKCDDWLADVMAGFLRGHDLPSYEIHRENKETRMPSHPNSCVDLFSVSAAFRPESLFFFFEQFRPSRSREGQARHCSRGSFPTWGDVMAGFAWLVISPDPTAWVRRCSRQQLPSLDLGIFSRELRDFPPRAA